MRSPPGAVKPVTHDVEPALAAGRRAADERGLRLGRLPRAARSAAIGLLAAGEEPVDRRARDVARPARRALRWRGG